MLRSVAACVVVSLLTAVSCSQDPAVLSRQHFARGNQYFEQKKFREAIVEYLNAVKLDGQFGEARAKLADAYIGTGDAADALREYARAADLLPDNLDVQVKAGTLQLLGKQFPEAAARAQAVLAKNPNHVAARILLGQAWAGLNDFDGAIRQMEEAIASDPTESLAYASLGYVEAVRGNGEKAEEALKKAVEVGPKSVEARLALGDFYWASGRLNDAQQAYASVLVLEPRNLRANRRLAIFTVNTGHAADAEGFIRVLSEQGEGRERLALADYYLAMGREQEGLQLLAGLGNGKQAGALARLRLASIDLSKGQPDRALKTASDVLDQEPANVEAMIMKARAQLAVGKPTDALTTIKAADASNPGTVDVLLALGRICRATGDLDGATKAFTDATKINPHAIAALFELSSLSYARGGVAAAAQFANQAVQNAPNDPGAHLVLAQALTRLGDYAGAGAELDRLEEAFPKASLVQIQKGEMYVAKRDFAGAAHAYGRALALDPFSLQALTGVVSVNLATSRPLDASAAVEARLARTPGDSEVLMLAARIYKKSGDDEREEQTLRKIIAIAPATLDAYQLLGQSLVKGNKLEQARVEFEELIKRNPSATAARTAVAVILELQNKPDEARKRYEETLEVDPRAPIAANNLAWLYAERDGGDLDAALRLALMASAQLPNRPEVGDTLGWVYYKQNQVQLAIPHFQDSLAKDPGNPYYHYHLGLAYAKQMDRKAARSQLEEALRAKADFVGAGEARKVLASLQ